MADGVLLRVGELRHREPRGAVIGQEHGVVAEPALSARRGGHLAAAATFEDALEASLGVHIDERAHVLERASGGRLTNELVQVLPVGGMLTGEARRAEPRRPAEGSRLDARVVGDGDGAARSRRRPCLAEGVPAERVGVLGRQDNLVWQRRDLGAVQEPLELPALVIIMGRQQKPKRTVGGYRTIG